MAPLQNGSIATYGPLLNAKGGKKVAEEFFSQVIA